MRTTVFLIFIFMGAFLMSKKNKALRFVITMVYFAALFYYTLISRVEFADTVTDNVIGVVAEQHWYTTLIYHVFKMKTNSYWEGFWYNILLFVPMGYIIPAWCTFFRRKRRILGATVVFGTSVMIELMQEITGFGMFDIFDLIANTVGGILGLGLSVIFVKSFEEDTDTTEIQTAL